MKGKILKHPLDLIGNTPLFYASNIKTKYNLDFNLYLKLEKYNLTSSSKDRLVKEILESLKDTNIDTVIEATSGNTGISLACLANFYNMKAIIIMPEGLSEERYNLIETYNGKVIKTKKELGMKGSVSLANKLKEEIPNSIILSQFENPLGILAHYKSTGPEIFTALDGKVDYFFAGIGTGTTFTGTSKYLKEQDKSTICIAVKPENVVHKIQGIGPNFTPPLFDFTLADKIVKVSDEEAYEYTNELKNVEGLLCGISSGAALAALIKEKEKIKKGANVVILLPDDGKNYLSTDVFRKNN